MPAELELTGVSTRRGTAQVLFDIDLSVDRGEAVGVIGRNGVGKTTLLRSIVGLSKPFRGSVTMSGNDITGWSAHRIAREGLRFVPDHRGIVGELTVTENLQLFAEASHGSVDTDLVDLAYETFPDLRPRQKTLGARLSGGQQQMLSIARAMVARPKILLLDEPFEGLAPQVVSAIGRSLNELRSRDVTLVLVEQSKRALGFVERVYVIDKGRVVHTGPTEDLLDAPELLQQYLGVSG